jgi:hypothetical protein
MKLTINKETGSLKLEVGNKKYNTRNFLLIFVLLITVQVFSQTPDQLFKAAGSPVNPKVIVSWNRYNDHAGITEICKKIAAAYPDLAKLESIGKL